MKNLLISIAAVALIGAGDAPKLPLMLSEQDLDVSLILPPPPVESSAEAIDERAELHRIDAARTPEELSAAKHDDDTKDASIFAAILGPKFDLAQLPRTTAMFKQLRADEKAVVTRGKTFFARKRPWIGDDALHPCSTDDEPLTSYPSGHATMGYSYAAMMARLVPARAQAFMARAASYGRARVICEAHFRSDVAAGEALGLIVTERLMAKPEFRKLFDAASKELRAKGL
jgi:acid phosphatase (class A)